MVSSCPFPAFIRPLRGVHPVLWLRTSSLWTLHHQWSADLCQLSGSPLHITEKLLSLYPFRIKLFMTRWLVILCFVVLKYLLTFNFYTMFSYKEIIAIYLVSKETCKKDLYSKLVFLKNAAQHNYMGNADSVKSARVWYISKNLLTSSASEKKAPLSQNC